MRRISSPIALVAMLLASAALAQLSASYSEFPTSPAGFLMTSAEQKAYAALRTDAEAQAFIDLFWARRDTNADTVFNEAKADFEAKAAAADKQFGYEGGKGSVSDRARVFYIMGVPSAPVEGIAAAPVDEEDERPMALRKGASQIWKYAKVQLPKSKDDFVSFYFVESKAGAGDFVLDPKDRRNKEAMKVLAERQEKLILHPKLTEVPRLGLITGTKAATSAQLAVLATEPRPWPEGAQIFATSGVLSESVHPLWVHVDLPDAVPPATQAIGRVTKTDGAEVGSFFMNVVADSLTGARAYEFSIPIEAGTYKVDIALLNESATLAIGSVEATSEPVTAGATYISPLYSGAKARQEPAKMGDPFNVGGWKLVLRPSNTFAPSEEVTYFCYIVDPGKDETGNPKYTMDFKLTVNGKPGGARPGTPIGLSKISDKLFMYGSGLPLTAFSKPGEYKLEITLLDKVTNATRTSTITVVIPPAAAPAQPAAPAAPAK